jgi:hypothetical protein
MVVTVVDSDSYRNNDKIPVYTDLSTLTFAALTLSVTPDQTVL